MLLNTQVKSQNIKPPSNIKSPTASNLGKYGDVGVSFFNGTTDINVPIYSITEGNIPLNINLRYDSGGIRVSSVASWVGQNWSLNAGGIITRTKRGNFIDEKLFPYIWQGVVYANMGFLYTKQKLDTPVWADPTYLATLAIESGIGYPNPNPNLYRYMDLEPDIFNFNFMGHTGSFFLGNDGDWKVQSENSNLKISILEADFRSAPNFVQPSSAIVPFNYERTISKILIEDELGNQFIFGLTNNSIEYVSRIVKDVGYAIMEDERNLPANAWYLSQVKDKDGQLVYEFEYERGKPLTSFYRQNYYKVSTVFDPFNTDPNNSWSLSVDALIHPSYTGNLIFPSYLKKITTLAGNTISFSSSDSEKKPYAEDLLPGQSPPNYSPMGSVLHEFNRFLNNSNFPTGGSSDQQKEFYYNQLEWRKLDDIIVTDYNDNQINKYQLNYNLASQSNRLNLESINSFDKTNNAFEIAYAFEYDDFDALPSYLSKKFDHWGFFNGNDYIVNHSGNQNLPQEQWFWEHDLSRAANEAFLTKGLLKKIIYPTKGYSLFTYEAHNANQFVNDYKVLTNYDINTTIGGVRIKEVTKFNGSNFEDKRTYEYENGILYYRPVYTHPNWKTSELGDTQFFFDINNMIPLSNINGSHIGYSKVRERYLDNSYIEYEFTNYNDFPDQAFEGTLSYSRSVFDKGSDRSFQRGKLKKTSIYSASNVLVEKNEYMYRPTSIVFEDNYVKAFEYSIPKYQGMGTSTGNAYKLFYMNYDVIEETKTKYLGGNQLTSTTTYEKEDYPISLSPNRYNGARRLLSTTAVKSNGKSLKTKYGYLDNCTTGDCMSDLYGLNNEEFTYEGNSLNTNNDILIHHSYNKYELFNGKRLLEKTQLANINNELKDKVIYHKYDSYGNPMEISKADGIHTIILWGYKSNKVIAEIKNVSYENLSDQTKLALIGISEQSDLDTDLVSENNLRTHLNTLKSLPGIENTMIKTYTHDPLVGVTSITDERDYTFYYIYDDFNRLKYIKDKEGNILSESEYNFKN